MALSCCCCSCNPIHNLKSNARNEAVFNKECLNDQDLRSLTCLGLQVLGSGLTCTKMRTASSAGYPGAVTSKIMTSLTAPYLVHSSPTSSSSSSSTSPGPTCVGAWFKSVQLGMQRRAKEQLDWLPCKPCAHTRRCSLMQANIHRYVF